jgi:methylmalonyl-CoA/ethylmalonyl-CoA epimerase
MPNHIMRLDHFAFEVTDLDRAIAFYTEVIGLPLLSKQVDEEHQEAFAFLQMDSATLELLQPMKPGHVPAASPRSRGGNSPHLM